MRAPLRFVVERTGSSGRPWCRGCARSRLTRSSASSPSSPLRPRRRSCAPVASFRSAAGPRALCWPPCCREFRIRNLPGDAEHGWAREWAGRKPQVGLPHYQTWRADAAGELKPVNVVQSGRNVYLYIDFVSMRPRAVALRDGLRVSDRADGDEDGTREVCTRATHRLRRPGARRASARRARSARAAAGIRPRAHRAGGRPSSAKTWVAHEGPPEVLHPTREHRRLPWSKVFLVRPLMQLTLVDARSHRPVSGHPSVQGDHPHLNGPLLSQLARQADQVSRADVGRLRARVRQAARCDAVGAVCSVMGDGLHERGRRARADVQVQSRAIEVWSP